MAGDISTLSKNRVKVVPIKDVVHTRYNELVGIKGHKFYYVNLLSGKITYKRGSVTLRTGHTGIMNARKFVEIKLRSVEEGKTIAQAERAEDGNTNPKLSVFWYELVALKTAETAKSTAAGYTKSWKIGFGPFWGTRHVSEVTDENILEYKSWYLTNHPTRSFEHTYVHLAMLFRYMVRVKALDKMPDLTPLKSIQEITDKNAKREAPGRCLNHEEEDLLIAALDNYQAAYRVQGTTAPHKAMLFSRLRLGVLCGVRGGGRKMEILALEWSRVDLKKKTMQLWSTKNYKWRFVPLVPIVVEAFKAQKAFSGYSKWVFPMPSDSNRHISSQVFDKAWVQLKKITSIRGRLRFHDLRHTFATRTAEDGWPPIVACDVLDQSLQIYQDTYCHASSRSKADWMKKSFEDRKQE